MTKDEILNYFKDINHAYNESTRYDELKRMLDELTEPCEDCISRQAVNKVIDEWIESGEYSFSNSTYYLRKRLEKAESEDA